MLKLILREWDLPTSGVNLAAEEAPFQWKGDLGRETGQQVQWDMAHWEVKPPWEPQNKHPNLCESPWGQGSKSQRRTSKTILDKGMKTHDMGEKIFLWVSPSGEGTKRNLLEFSTVAWLLAWDEAMITHLFLPLPFILAQS